MKKTSLLLPTLSGLFLSATILSTTVQAEETAGSQPSSDQVTILHTNDIHGRIEEGRDVIGMAKLATAVEEARQEGPTLVLDAGDAFQGLPISNSTKGEDMAELMNDIGYDAMAVGNHEFDFSLEQAEKYKQSLNFPLLSANTYVNGARLFEASTIVDKTPDVSGDEFVVIGVTTPETSTKTHPNNVNGVEFRDPITEVTNVITEIEARQSYNNYVILAHLGIDSTTPVAWQGSTLAEALAANELLKNKRVIVIDGHSHTVSQAKYGTNVTYTQTGSYLNNIGKITLSQAGVEAGLITTKDGKALTANPAIAEKVAAIKAKYDAENAVVVLDNSPVELNGDRENVRVRETNLGNLVADALWDYGQTGFSHPTHLAVTNGGGLRATIAKDKPVTKGDIIAVLPFGNIISQIEVTGQQIKEMFTKSLGSTTQQKEGQPVLDSNGNPLLEASGGFLHVSGAYVVYDTNLPAEERILGIQIYDKETETYKDLDLTKTYYLATNDFLAAGGDGYNMLGGKREEGPSMDSVLSDFLRKTEISEERYGQINPETRLVSVKKDLDTDGDGFVDYVELLAETNLEDKNDYPGKTTPPVTSQPIRSTPTAEIQTNQPTASSAPAQTPINSSKPSLPNTGEQGSGVALLGSAALVAALGLAGLRRRSK
ncbi:cell surface ecto-5'-nucleotidase Nt5e [Streptococcus entericus]|uniref:cell surface ecto-5'-nucleotidase Nt5e n=1 Tax=Streptococcus entericus TaxID=155680 RepID=UPI000366C534|nr:cell surface ecto-5'-nucleotidase Nt5e [Streptococcus entericus]